jgi:hypothetical protein
MKMVKSYSEKAERAFRQHEAVRKIVEKKDIQQNLYIKNRQKALVETKKWVNDEKK